MSRDVTARRALVLAAFDRCTSSPADGDVSGFMACVADTGVDRFGYPATWPIEAVRSVLEAYLAHAPEADLDDMLGRAQAELTRLTAMELELAEAR